MQAEAANLYPVIAGWYTRVGPGTPRVATEEIARIDPLLVLAARHVAAEPSPAPTVPSDSGPHLEE